MGTSKAITMTRDIAGATARLEDRARGLGVTRREPSEKGQREEHAQQMELVALRTADRAR